MKVNKIQQKRIMYENVGKKTDDGWGRVVAVTNLR